MSATIPAVCIGTKYVLDASAIDRIRSCLRGGGLVVHPTDTVYGLAADPFQTKAVDRLYAAKARPRELAVSMAVADVEDIFRFGMRTPLAENFCRKNLPGPFTVVLRATREAPAALVNPQGLIGLRIPDHPIPRLLARSCGPITTTSANRHGQPSPTTCDEAKAELGDAVDLYIDAGPAPLGAESSVVDLSGPKAKVLRQGALPTRA
ncbi:MAG TPA: L-threonylcarbamoyladenylate synthase [Thermoplasmata archaeon]|nr:L-threonylcarbamoyladenylate synthase [Thermoplasmata archaeon]